MVRKALNEFEIRPELRVIQPSKIKKELPHKTTSLCPECPGARLIEAMIVEENGMAIMKKTCPEHGEFKDVIQRDVNIYKKLSEWAYDGIGVTNPALQCKGCPESCGLCDIHLSHTALALIDLTNRCNLKCPICFANANSAGYIYEPNMDQIRFMLQTLRDEKPVPATAVQFSGGEPTIYPRFLDVLRMAKEMGFAQIQIASNGIRLAEEPGFATACEEAGLHTVYLQFDGMKPENYIRARGRNLLDIKIKAVQNCENAKPTPLAVVLVPTLVMGINDDQCGPILDFAIKHRKAVRGVNYQPVALTGRISKEEVEKGRFTIADLMIKLEEQTGYIKRDDFYPVTFVTPISQLISVLKGEKQLTFTNHPQCGAATFLIIDDENQPHPITRFVDVEGLFTEMLTLAQKLDSTLAQTIIKIGKKVTSEKRKKTSFIKNFRKYFGKYILEDKIPKGFDVEEFMFNMLNRGDKKSIGDFMWRTMYIGAMHFQDHYDYDIERLMRCDIHYAAPDGRIYPFCAYNAGPYYRKLIEEKYSMTIEEWRKQYKEMTIMDYIDMKGVVRNQQKYLPEKEAITANGL